MKNTMKKLLCMALAIMLLVSAVPVFAAADNVSLPYDLYVDGALTQGVIGTTTTKSLEQVLEVIYPGYSARYNVGFEINGATVSGSAGVPSAGTVTFRLTTPPTPTPEPVLVVVNVVLNGVGKSTFNVEKGSSITLNEALLNSRGLSLSYNHSIAQWSDLYTGAPIANGTTVTVNENNTFTCVQRANATSSDDTVGIITAIFSVDGGSSVEKKVSANSKTVAELIAMCGYSGYDLDKAGLGGSGAAKGLNDTITAGQKVYIKMKTRATPTTPTNPSTPTTPSTSNYIKFAVKVDSSSNVVYDGGKTPANGSSAKIGDLIKNLYDSNWASKYTFDYAWSSKNQTNITDVNATVYTGDTVTVMLKTKSSSSSSSGINYGTNGRTVHFLCAGQVIYSKVVKNDAELAVAKSEAAAKIVALGCYKFNGWK